MNAQPKNKEEEIILRVFALIKESHFNDHKMVPDYLRDFRFRRNLGGDIGNYVQAKFPEYYHEERRRLTEK
jgi:hypothetical protein